MITDVPGIKVGHWTDDRAQTGCTVVVLPESTVASGEVRGGAPAEREFALLSPERQVPGVDAVILSGGSAFGLAAADGVVGWLETNGRGFSTKGGRVPIVVGMSLYDLTVGDGSVRPGPDQGYEAAAAASDGPFAQGLVGAGTGATVGKWGGPTTTRPGGIVSAAMVSGPLVVGAIVAVNSFGFIDDGTTVGDPGPSHRSGLDPDSDGSGTNTTIGVVATNATLTKAQCLLVAQSAHDGLARSVYPAHTSVDGDAFVAAATGQLDDVDLMHLRVLAQNTVARAVRQLLT